MVFDSSGSFPPLCQRTYSATVLLVVGDEPKQGSEKSSLPNYVDIAGSDVDPVC